MERDGAGPLADLEILLVPPKWVVAIQGRHRGTANSSPRRDVAEVFREGMQEQLDHGNEYADTGARHAQDEDGPGDHLPLRSDMH